MEMAWLNEMDWNVEEVHTAISLWEDDISESVPLRCILFGLVHVRRSDELPQLLDYSFPSVSLCDGQHHTRATGALCVCVCVCVCDGMCDVCM